MQTQMIRLMILQKKKNMVKKYLVHRQLKLTNIGVPQHLTEICQFCHIPQLRNSQGIHDGEKGRLTEGTVSKIVESEPLCLLLSCF